MTDARLSEPWHSWLAERLSAEAVEEGTVLAPKFDKDGLLPVTTTDAASGSEAR
jgi:phosphoribosyl-AMP cyclohydrolase